jgi:hypothetical protein
MVRGEEHIQELLKLPVAERARAAKRLLDSIEAEANAAVLRHGGDVARLPAELRAGLDADDASLRTTAKLRVVRSAPAHEKSRP